MFNVGTQELLVILVVVLLLFGAKRIPEVARSFGKGLADFRDAMSGIEREIRDETMGRAAPEAERRAPPARTLPSAAGSPQAVRPTEGPEAEDPSGGPRA